MCDKMKEIFEAILAAIIGLISAVIPMFLGIGMIFSLIIEAIMVTSFTLLLNWKQEQ